MKTFEQTITTTMYQSEVLVQVQTTNPTLAPIIQWADEHPVVWQVVTTKRSKAFGLGSNQYLGSIQSSIEPGDILERVKHIHDIVECKQPCYTADSIFVWRAKFTLAHYNDKKFTGGFFQQHDAQYPRSCLTLDYTPETYEEVLDRFCAWMDASHDTHHVTINGKTVRTFPREEVKDDG